MKQTLSLLALVLFLSQAVLAQRNQCLPPLHVDGKWIKDANGNQVTLRGVNVYVTKWSCANEKEEMLRRIDQAVDPNSFGEANVIRLALHSALFGKNYQKAYEWAREAIDYCKQKKLYVIVDYHHFPNKYGGTFQESIDFWKYAAPRLANDDNILLACANEPVYQANQFNVVRTNMQQIVNTIRQHAKKQIIIAQGTNYTNYIAPYANNPLNDPGKSYNGGKNNIMYESHIYPHNGGCSQNGDPRKWDRAVGNVPDNFPVLIGEWATESERFCDNGNPANYFNNFTAWLDQNPNISATAWNLAGCGDSHIMMSNVSGTLNDWGRKWKNYIKDKGYRVSCTPTPPPPSAQQAYNGPHTIPGVVEAEDFDQGGQGVAYRDVDAANQGGAYRQQEAVDLGTVNNRVVVGWTAASEWLEYTVVADEGSYEISLVVASAGTGKRLQLTLDGQSLGTITAPRTGSSWPEANQRYQSVTLKKEVALLSGKHILRISMPQGGVNLDKIIFKRPTNVDYSGYYVIKNRASGLNLRNQDCQTGNYTPAELYEGTGDCAQWQVVEAADGYFHLKNKRSGLNLRSQECATAEGTLLELFDGTWHCAQWKLIDAGGGYVHLENRRSGLKARNQGCQAVNDQTLVELVDGTGNCAQWQLIPVGNARVASKDKAKEAMAVDAISSEPLVQIYPNPSTNKLMIRFTEGGSQEVHLVNLQGQILVKTKLSAGQAQLDVSTLPKGLYLVKVGQHSERILLE